MVAAAAASSEEVEDSVVPVYALGAAVFTASAIFGYVSMSQCSEAKAERAERLRQQWRRSQTERLQQPTDEVPTKSDRSLINGVYLEEEEPESNAAPRSGAEAGSAEAASSEQGTTSPQGTAESAQEGQAEGDEQPTMEDLERWGGPSESEEESDQ